ncbi:AAA family ATPase [Nonomuraea sp. NPDC050310]|uniref:AAA family ATPase n=1 Tax=Nonomuraea sp. NPDC050310 TaxID=3154935 RepID=UPI0033E0A563
MRPHLLTLTAFGSFPGSESVDFDALTEAGLFLVHGPTGAGKTTVLDGLCYALYGQVPGQRNSARSLRCDHAPPGAGPSVRLEVTIRGRRLRVERSPAWQRPKLRGTGFTEEKAKVILSEHTGGAWTGLTTRADEAGDLIGGLLGMNADQFCQVAMLPQGDFARFLRADGEDRRRLLERLFTVKVFTQAEAWLAEERRTLGRAQQELRQQVDFAVQRIDEAAGEALLRSLTTAASDSLSPVPPPTLPPAPPHTSAPFHPTAAPPSGPVPAEGPAPADGAAGSDGLPGPGPVGVAGPAGEAGLVGAAGTGPGAEELARSGALRVAAAAVAAQLADRSAAATRTLRTARAALDQATALADRQRRHADALTLRRTLDERADERADLAAILDEAARADRVMPLLTAARHRAEALAKTRTLATDALTRAHPLLTSARDAVAPAHPQLTSEPPRTPLTSPAEGGRSPLTSTSEPARSPLTSGSEPTRPQSDGASEIARLAELERGRRSEIARLSELLTEEARLSVVRRDLANVEAELIALAQADEATAARLAALPAQLATAEQALAAARLDAARIPAAEAAVAAARDLIGVERELATLDDELETLTQREAEVAALEADLPARHGELSARLAEIRAEAAAVPAARATAAAASAALDAAHRRDQLAADLQAATATLQALVDHAQASRERWLDIRQARLEGMAAELARDLAEGAPCAVCGSADHPSPAAPAPSAPSAEDERAAEAAHESALAEREAAELLVATLESRLTDATEAAGGLDLPAAAAALDAAQEELARLESVAELEPGLQSELDRVEAARERVREQAREVGEALAAHRTHRTQLHAERTRLLARTASSAVSEHSEDSQVAHAMGVRPGDPHAASMDAGDSAAQRVDGLAAGDFPSLPLGEGHAGPDAPHAGGSADDGAAEWAGRAGPTSQSGSHGGPAPQDGPAPLNRPVSQGEPSDTGRPGDPRAGLRMLAAAQAEVAGLRRSAAREQGLAAEVERLRAERAQGEEESKRIAARLAAGRTRREELGTDAARLTSRLDEARGADPTLTARLSRLADEAELLHEALEATTVAATAAEEYGKAVQAAEAAARNAGFPSTEDAEEAARTPAEREAKAERLRELDAQHAAVTQALADPELVAAAARPAPDLDALAESLAEAEAEHTALVSAHDQAVARERRLAQLHEELAACLARWRPAAERHRLAERMAALASGTSSDNQWSMSLSSFVLGERLRQVVDAANERLDHMSGGRYQLQHDLRKTAGARSRAGGGLGLRVADGWTGVDRDPATLSGGESFITSLALALGLADVVAAESGGAEIGTLFVDEGFGTLDEDTLDGVLDILDGLRDGGRAVGIVSHVGELRSRIPAQLKVAKTRAGSTLSVAVP